MKKIDLGQMLQIAGNAGVIVGILLLVYELNQNRDMMAAQTRNSIAETRIGAILSRATNAEFVEATLMVEAGEDVSPVQRTMWQGWRNAGFREWENVYYQYRNGLFAQSEYESLRNLWLNILEGDATRDLWCSRPELRSQPLFDEMNALLGELRCD